MLAFQEMKHGIEVQRAMWARYKITSMELAEEKIFSPFGMFKKALGKKRDCVVF